jgi:hypothetical protein
VGDDDSGDTGRLEISTARVVWVDDSVLMHDIRRQLERTLTSGALSLGEL